MAKTIQQLKAEIKDLSGRLYYCSNTGEGRKVRKEIETTIRVRQQELDVRIANCAGCVSDTCENCN